MSEGEIQYGFLHAIRVAKRALTTRNRKANRPVNYDGILGELVRAPGYCPHVETPQEPIHVFGLTAAEMKVRLDDWYRNTKIERIGRDGPYKTRPMETQTRLHAAVVSYPVAGADMTAADEELSSLYFELSDAFVRRLYGGHLLSIYEHRDEKYRHRHYLAFAEDPSVELHPCYRAKQECHRRGELGRMGNQAFVKAGKELQGRFWAEVSNLCGFGHKDNSNPSIRLPMRAVREIARHRKLAEEAGLAARPALLENQILRRRVEELTALAEAQDMARAKAERALRVKTRAVEAMTDRTADVERTGEQAIELWRVERQGREAAQAAFEDENRLRRKADAERVEAKALSDVLAEQLDAMRLEAARSQLVAKAAREEVARLEAELVERDGLIARLWKLVPAGSGGGTEPVPATPKPVRTPPSDRLSGARPKSILEADSKMAAIARLKKALSGSGSNGGGEARER